MVMKHRLCIIAEKEDIKEIDKIAKKEERSRSYLIRNILSSFVKKNLEVQTQ